jgi:SynChlorMet cassette protein ScmC
MEDACLALADGASWSVIPGDEPATHIVSRLKQVMNLGRCAGPSRRLLVCTDEDPPPETEAVRCSTTPPEVGPLAVYQLREVAAVFCRAAEARGGLLLHGALAALGGDGVILAGPGGRGKTTASRRLPPPWRALSDDSTLVVRDDEGRYWAHPWPTWGSFMYGRPGGSWDCSSAVRLRGVYFLVKAPGLRVEPAGTGQAVCLLVEAAEQTWRTILRAADEADARAERLQRLDSATRLAREVPCFSLHLGLTSPFWRALSVGEAP